MGARSAARKTRLTAPRTLFQLLGLGVIALGLGHGGTAVRAGEITATTGTLGLGTVVNSGVSCTSGACAVTGGTSAGSNLFHRFDVFDTRGGAITGVTFDPGRATNIIVGVLAPAGSFINRPISITGGSADLFWLSPGGLSIGNGGQFSGFSNLTLSTATDMLIGGLATFNYQNTLASDILNGSAGFDGVPLNGLGSQGLTSTAANPGALSIDGALLTVDQSLLLDAENGSVSLTASSIEPFAKDSPPSITINADTIALAADANQNRTSINADNITLQGRVITANKSDLTASNGDLTLTATDSGQAQSALITASTLSSNAGSISMDAGSQSFGSFRIQISNSDLNATGGNITLLNGTNETTSASNTGVLISDNSSLTATAGAVEFPTGIIDINGSGAFRICSTSCFSRGIEVNNNSSLSADTITLTGSGGNGISGGGGNDSIAGVPASDTAGISIDSSVLNANSLSLTGNAGSFNTDLARGIQINSAQLSGTQTLLLNGSGGTDVNNDSSGIRITASTLSSGDSGTAGSLSLSGQGGYTNGTGPSRGILIDNKSSLATTGGSLTLTGTPGLNLNSGEALPNDKLSAVLINDSSLSGTSFNGSSPTLQINSLGSDTASGSALQDGFAIQNSQIDGFALIDINSAGRLNLFDSTLSTSGDGSISLTSSFVPSLFSSPETALNIKGASLSVPSTGTAIAISADSITIQASSNGGGNTTITGPTISIQGQKSAFSNTSITATNGNINVNGTNNISRDDTLIGSLPSMELADSSLTASNGSLIVSAFGPLSLTNTDLTALSEITLGTQTAASSLGTIFSDASLLASAVTSSSDFATFSAEGGPLSILQSTLNTQSGPLSLQSAPFYAGDTTLAADAASVRIGNSTLITQGGSLTLQGSTNSLGSQDGAGIAISSSSLSATGGNISLINSVNNVPTSVSSTGILIDGQSNLTASATQVEGSPVGGSITINGSGAFRNGTVSGFSRGIEINGNSSLSADTITLTGSGGDDSRGGGSDSVLTSDTTGLAIDSSVLNANSLSLTGYAGNLNTTLAEGIRLSASKLSGRQTLLLNGTGGTDANGDSTGIRISASTLSSGDSGTAGSLSLSGRAGETNGTDLHRGILIDNKSSLATVGGSLTLTGEAGLNLSAVLINDSSLSGTSFNGSSPTLQINSLGSDTASGSALQDGFAIQNSQIDGFALIDINSAGRLNLFDSTLSTSGDGSISLTSSFIPSLFSSPETALNIKGASLSVPSTGTAIAISADSITIQASSNGGGNTTITGPTISIQGQKSAFSNTSITATNGDLTVLNPNDTSESVTLIGSLPSMEFVDSSLTASQGDLLISAYGPLKLNNTDLTALTEISLSSRTAASSNATIFNEASLFATGVNSLAATTSLSVEGGPINILQSTFTTQSGPLSLQSAPFLVGGTTITGDANSVRIGNSTLVANGGSLTVQGSTNSVGTYLGQGNEGVAISASSLSATGGDISVTNTADTSVSASSTGVLIDGNSSLTATATLIRSSPVGGAITINGSGAFRTCSTSCFSHGIEINGNSSLSADTITITGSGGDGISGGGGNDSLPGVPASDTSGLLIGSSVLSANSLSLTGNAGSFNTDLARGIQINSAQLSGTQTLLLNGNGGYDANNDSSGILISASTLSSGDSGTPGSLSLSGQGGYTNGTGPSRGLLIDNKSSLASTGGSLTLTGTPGLNLNSGDALPNDKLSAILIDASTLSGTSFNGSSPTLQINSLGSDTPSGSAVQDGFAIQNSQIDGFALIDINSAGRLNLFDSKMFTSSDGSITVTSSFAPLTTALATMASDGIVSNPSPAANATPPPPATINLSNSTLSTFPKNLSSGSGSGGSITIKADSIAIYKTSLTTSGTNTGGEITIGADPDVGDNYLTDTVSIYNSSLIADPPTLGGIINIYGKNISILDSTLNLKGGSGGSLTAGGPGTQVSPSNTTFLLLNGNTFIYSSSDAPLQFNSSGTLINDAQINPVPPSPPPNPGPPLDNPTVAVLLKQTLAQDPLSTDPQTSTQIAETGGPLLSDTTPQNTPSGEIAVNLVPSGGIPITQESGSSPPEGTIPLDQRPAISLSSDEARQSFDSGNAEAKEDTARKLGLTEDEKLTPPSAADLQKAMQAATRWIRSGATGGPSAQNSCGGEGQTPCGR